MPRLLLLCLLATGLLTGCLSAGKTLTSPAPTASPTAVQIGALSVATSMPAATVDTPVDTPAPEPWLCSPLQDESLDQITRLISNPFHPPQPGSDEPHQGVDLAIRAPDSQIAVAGNPVQAVLAGRVAMVTQDRFPFGNAVILETPLDTLPAAFLTGAAIPTPAPTLALHSALTCPPGPSPVIPDTSQRSLYLLYAHLAAPADLKPGDSLACGQVFGAVGMTGNALNPHLHFEAKAGPSGLRIDSMAHYDASASLDEMRHYCLWSISGMFQLVDPLKILQSNP